MVVTGDITQVDLPATVQSGLVEASEVLDGVEGVAVCRLTAADVVRHPLGAAGGGGLCPTGRTQNASEAFASIGRSTPQSLATAGRM